MKAKSLLPVFIITAIGFSVFKESDYSVWVKPLPVLCCFLILFLNGVWNRPVANLVIAGLAISILGDIALDLSVTTVGIAIFTLVMSIYGFALFKAHNAFSRITLIPTLVIFGGIYLMMLPHLEDRRISAAVYQVVLIWMVWRGAVILLLETRKVFPTTFQKWLIFLGTLGIAMNGVLYGIDLYLYAIPRDVVIHSYYLGQLALVLGLIEWRSD